MLRGIIAGTTRWCNLLRLRTIRCRGDEGFVDHHHCHDGSHSTDNDVSWVHDRVKGLPPSGGRTDYGHAFGWSADSLQ